jgi:hypothetical protein
MIDQEDFDRIALFVAVASELRREPFLSEDNHDRLTMLDKSSDRPFAHFCHPAFLKSALLPFRKLWLDSEKCSFEKVRDLVFEHHHDQAAVAIYRPFLNDLYLRTLDQPADKEWARESTREILNMWIYTQGIHAGQREDRQGRTINQRDPTPQQFDQWAHRIGREKFEYLFRVSLKVVGGIYVQFLDKFAAPMFWKLNKDGMVPGFEARGALEYNPYPDSVYRITFDDVFWHLDKESMEETFDRLLERESYRIVQGLFRGLFEHRAAALVAICQSENLTALFEVNRVVLLQERPPFTDQSLCRQETSHFSLLGPIAFDVLKERRVWLDERTRNVFEEVYRDFRSCLFREREKQRRPNWQAW